MVGASARISAAAEYIAKHDLNAALTKAVNQVLQESHPDPKQRIAELLSGAHKGTAEENRLPPILPISAKKHSNDENEEAFRIGELKHAPPKVTYFDPTVTQL